MTFGRWLLIHSLSISIVVMLGVGYFFKNELKLSEAYNQLLLIDSSKLVISNADKDKETDEAAPKESNVVSNKTVDIRKSSIEKLSNKDLVNRVKEKSAELNIDTSNQVISSQDKQKTIDKKPQIEAEPVDTLLKAREAYWNENYQYAIELYSAEIAENPNSADLYGELGNIYYGLKNYDAASTHYLKAGEILIFNRDETRAKKVYDILTSIAPKKADSLLQLKNQQHQ